MAEPSDGRANRSSLDECIPRALLFGTSPAMLTEQRATRRLRSLAVIASGAQVAEAEAL